MSANLFDLLGIARSLGDRATPAAAKWPAGLASLTSGINASSDTLTLVNTLNAGTSFTNIRPGVDAKAQFGSGAAGQFSIAADMAIAGAPATTAPMYLHALPDLGIQLQVTDPLHPARVYAAVDGRGFEVIIDRLPVTLFLKSGLATALTGAPVSVGTFDSTAIDSFAYTLGDSTTKAQIQCFVRLHLTTAGDVILEPTVPISFGPVRWMGLPSKAVYDIQILPSPSRTEYLEWTHNDPGSFFSNPPAKGAIGFRSIDLDYSQPPLSDLKNRLQGGAVNADKLEIVLEDVVVPATVPGLPIPSHGTFGFRRKITDPGDIQQAYSFTNAPVQVQVYKSSSQGGNGGTTLTLEVDSFFFRTGDVHAMDPGDLPQVQFSTALIYQSGTGPKIAATTGIDDEWTLFAGIALDPATTPVKMTIADTTVGVVGLKFGVSISRIANQMQFKDSFELLGDLFVQGKPSSPGGGGAFQITSLTGKPMSVVMRGIGYKLGNPSLSGLSMPDGMQLIFARLVHVIIEEMGWVEETNGTPYFSFSGGVMIGGGGGNAQAPQGNAPDNSGNGFGIRVRRLRFRLNSDGSQPFLKLDGIFLKLHYGPVDVEGFGYISDYTDSGWNIKEWGFGAKVALSAIAMQFSLSAMFLKGTRRNLSDATQDFSYFLAALELGFLPAGPIGLYDIRALVADNMAPNLDSTFPDGEGMALLKWHQSHDNALTMPSNRNLADWLAQKDAFDFGVGCGFSLNGCGGAAHLSVFIFFEKAQANTGILIVGELYILKNPKPIAFVAIEYDIDKEKFGVMVGVDLSLGDFASGALPGWLGNIARLTGNLYFGNQPWSFAIGQLADQSTWLSLIINFDIWLTIKFQLGVCVQIVDGGPKGFGVVVTLSAGADWGVGGFTLWGTFGLIIGTWKTGSDSSGIEFWIGLGFKINLFWIFSFGAEANFKITYLGKHPWYVTLHAEIKIDTPWFLPDVTVSFDKTWQEPMPFDTASVTQGLSLASAIDPTAQKGTPLLLPGLAGSLGDASFLYTFNQITGIQGIRIADTHAQDVPIVSVDSTIVIDFTQPVSNDTLIATTTYSAAGDAGVQTVQDLKIRYGLQSVSVRRAPRFGPTAGVWTDLIKASDTTFSVGGSAPQSLTFAWDTDQRADGRLAPKRLLINSAAPYSFATSAPQNDEEAARNDADYPCCNGSDARRLYPKPHVLQFTYLPIGARVPATEQFSGKNGAWWHWTLSPRPAVVPGDPVWAGSHTARIVPRGSALAGVADLPEPAALATLELAWDNLPGTLTFEAYAGLQLAGSKVVALNAAGSTSLSIDATPGSGITRITIRFDINDAAFNLPPTLADNRYSTEAAIRILQANYITLADTLIYAGATQRCKNGAQVGPPGSDASGKLAFLPNHDYEVVVTNIVQVGSKDQGPRQTPLSEALYFRTKGLPGLNAAPNVGDDIRRHVATTYPPRRAMPIYRHEPCVLAFENSLSSVLPIDRTPAPGSPPEKAQMFPLELNVDRVGSMNGMQRLTVPSNDWITAHRVNPYPPVIWVAGLGGFAKSTVRHAASADPLVLRYEAVKAAMPLCGPQDPSHASQVLLHEPIGPDGSAGTWEASTGYRATVRQQGGPFTERSSFDIYDLGAFIRLSDGASAPLWSVNAQHALQAPAAAGGTMFYAGFGDPTWDHLQVHTRVDPRPAPAGIAVGITASGSHVQQAIIATVESAGGAFAVVLRARSGGTVTELARATVTVTGPVLLDVTVFDDVVRAGVGDTTIDAPRGAIREGLVALVASGPAIFSGVSAGALSIYAFEFITSRFGSFFEHLQSWDGKLPVMATGAFGGVPATVASVLAANAGAIPGLMTADADPQARQALFSKVVSALGIGLSKSPRVLTAARLTDATGTAGIVLQSPEPLALTSDVTLTLTRHIRTWVWDVPPHPVPPLPVPRPVPVPIPTPGPVFSPAPLPAQRPLAAAMLPSVAGIARLGLITPAVTTAAADLETAVPTLNFANGQVAGNGVLPGASIVRAIATPTGTMLEVYSAPGAQAGVRQQLLTPQQAAARADLAAAAQLKPGGIGVISGGQYGLGHWVESDISVPLTLLSNGDETAILMFSPGGAAWPAGAYTLHAGLDRDRWSNTGAADAEQHYHDATTLAFTW
jgi:hypothetical protein